MQKKEFAEIVKTDVQEGIKVMKKSYLFAGAAALLAVIAGCHFYGQKTGEMQMPSINVTVAEAKEEVINNPKTYVALVEAINSVDVVAKVSGSLDKVNFVEGSFVKKDDPLFVWPIPQHEIEAPGANIAPNESNNERKEETATNIIHASNSSINGDIHVAAVKELKDVIEDLRQDKARLVREKEDIWEMYKELIKNKSI